MSNGSSWEIYPKPKTGQAFNIIYWEKRREMRLLGCGGMSEKPIFLFINQGLSGVVSGDILPFPCNVQAARYGKPGSRFMPRAEGRV